MIPLEWRDKKAPTFVRIKPEFVPASHSPGEDGGDAWLGTVSTDSIEAFQVRIRSIEIGIAPKERERVRGQVGREWKK